MKKTAKRLLALMMALGLFVAALPATAEEPVDEWVPEVEEFDLGAIGEDEISLEEAAAGDDAPLAAGEEIALGSPGLAAEGEAAAIDTRQVYSIDPVEENLEFDSGMTEEELYGGYAARFFEGCEVPMAGSYLGDQLTGNCRAVYDYVKAEIFKIADGQRSNTVIEVPIGSVFTQTVYTPAELGVTLQFDEEGYLTEDCKQALYEAYKARNDMKSVANALQMDCTFELYWTMGITFPNVASAMTLYDENLGAYLVKVNTAGKVTFKYQVTDGYQLNNSFWDVDPSKAGVARRAAANARAIVNKYADCSDVVKLFAYAAEICHLTDYNSPAANHQGGVDGNPWTLIWVFDGDPETKVVCEGYAKAFQHLCDITAFSGGVRSILVAGTAPGGPHAWNVVHMDDGRNYQVDVTNMDAEFYDLQITDALIAEWVNCLNGGYYQHDNVSYFVGGLFLVGGSGSVSGGYDIRHRTGSGPWKYKFGSSSIEKFGASALTLASSNYTPMGFVKIGGKLYFIGANGHFLTGWQKIGDTVLQFGSDGALISGAAGGWQRIGSRWYYFDNASTMATGWRKLGGKWYYFEDSGAMATGWLRLNGVYYCFDASGAMLTGWQRSGGKWYYLNSSGAMATGWQKVGGSWYHFAGGGAMQTGWQKIGNYYYCFKNSGAMMTGWQQIGGKWYYFGGSGAMATGWQNLGGKWYCFASGGAMMTGWQAIGGRWYYFNASGAMMTGWQQIGGKWYYFGTSGAMATGWQQIGGKWYYFGTSGAMVTGTQTIGGRVYTFNNSGVWVG